MIYTLMNKNNPVIDFETQMGTILRITDTWNEEYLPIGTRTKTGIDVKILNHWWHGQRSSRQTHARYMESIQKFPYTVLQRRETSPLKNACRKQAGYFLCIASAPSLCQNKERIVAIKKLLCNHFT